MGIILVNFDNDAIEADVEYTRTDSYTFGNRKDSVLNT